MTEKLLNQVAIKIKTCIDMQNGATEDQLLDILLDVNNLKEFMGFKVNGNFASPNTTLPIQNSIPRFSVSLVYQNTTANMLRCLILNAENKHAALGEAIEFFEDETKGHALILKTVIELNKE